MRPNTRYLLVVDLSAFEFRPYAAVYSQHITPKLQQFFDGVKGGKTRIDLLVTPDARFFDRQQARFMSMEVKLDKMRRVRAQGGVSLDKSPFDLLREHPDDEISFGRVWASVKTTANTGWASIAIAIWANRSRPVGELFVPICVSTDGKCGGDPPQPVTQDGIDAIRLNAQGPKKSDLPDAALHFYELDGDVVGTFRCNTCPGWGKDQVVSWQLGKSAHELAEYLTRTILPDFENALKDEQFVTHGRNLYRLLFNADDTSGDAAEARRSFEAMVQQKARASAGGDPPSLFIRLFPYVSSELLTFPLGLMVPGQAAPAAPLGFAFRIESPLEIQDYRPGPKCISKWVLLAPPKDPPDQDMRQALKPFAGWWDAFGAWPGTIARYSSIGDFAKFQAEDEALKDPTVLLTISHHDANQLFFQQNSADTIPSVAISRPLAPLSVVIMNACGTAKPGAAEFVRQFNAKGAAAVIATSVAVDASMGGTFPALLLKRLSAGGKNPPTLGHAMFHATHDLRLAVSPLTKAPYGSAALIYTLLGNSSIRICSPPAPK